MGMMVSGHEMILTLSLLVVASTVNAAMVETLILACLSKEATRGIMYHMADSNLVRVPCWQQDQQ